MGEIKGTIKMPNSVRVNIRFDTEDLDRGTFMSVIGSVLKALVDGLPDKTYDGKCKLVNYGIGFDKICAEDADGTLVSNCFIGMDAEEG